MFNLYKEELLAHYAKLKIEHLISDNLEKPNRTKLRNECLKVYGERYSSNDDEMLKAFFDPQLKYNDHILSIQKFELDKFRSLVSFITENRDTRDEDAIKLFAWLINFPSYREWKKNGGKDQEQEPPKTPQKNNKVISVLVCLFVLLLGRGVFYLWDYQVSEIRMPLNNEKCMYWKGYCYEPVQCDRLVDDNVIPLNINKLKKMKRVSFLKKVTKEDIGQLWWGKIDKKVVYFTDSGINPIDTTKKLLPLSNYMILQHETKKNLVLDILNWTYFITFFLLSTILINMVLRKKYNINPN